jgi:hypothetical protein
MAKNNPDPKPLNINLNPENQKILYTDMIYIHVNEDGATFDICQKVGPLDQFHVVSRIGMSREHAKKLVNELSKNLALTQSQSNTGEEN